MVAPTRTPQARGVKCDLCKKILATATWLDQNHLAKQIEEADKVLILIEDHDKSGCLCIPRNIENLLVGSTHFEIHRLSAKNQDAQVFKKQDSCRKSKPSVPKESINDCVDHRNTSRFKISNTWINDGRIDYHLKRAIDFWRTAMEDQTNPFNSKLALRLGLTHHVIYACYFFKFYKILDYQLITANLLLRLFKTIEGVTDNAILHAYYLLIRSLLDCDQIQLAKHHLKQAVKLDNYKDTCHYESILLNSVSCEIGLLDRVNNLDDLAEMAKMQPDDKLQHYYARTMSLSIVIKYIHLHPARTNNCFEFFHMYRYICAIIRRCYESSFMLVLQDKENDKNTKRSNSNQDNIVDHSWIRPAICDFVFSSLELLSRFFIRAGMPEILELLYNGLELISCRTGNLYWHARLTAIGSSLDIVCDKLTHSEAKLNAISNLIEISQDQFIKDLTRLEYKTSIMEQKYEKGEVIDLDSINIISKCQLSLNKRLQKIEIYDYKSKSSCKLSEEINTVPAVNGYNFYRNSIKCYKWSVLSLLREDNQSEALKRVNQLNISILDTKTEVLDYDSYHDVLEILLYFTKIDQSAQLLLESVKSSNLFLVQNDGISSIQSGMSALSLLSTDTTASSSISVDNRRPTRRNAVNRLGLGRSRKGVYNVAKKSRDNIDPIEAIKCINSIDAEDILSCYLRHSEPNPNFLMYKRAHEMLFSIRLKDNPIKNGKDLDHSQLLYHFVESCSATTMRYRWMMFDEQQVKPFEPQDVNSKTRQITSKLLGFNSALMNPITKKPIPDNYRILQAKYILDKSAEEEHLLLATIENDSDPIYAHCKKTLSGDDFLEDARIQNQDIHNLALPNKFTKKVEEAKKTLFLKTSGHRTELRQKLETDLNLLLYSLETEWLGQFKFLFCGKIIDKDYNNFVNQIISEIKQDINDPSHALNSRLFRTVIEYAPLLSREEFCRLVGAISGSSYLSNEVLDCFNKWTKSMEAHVMEKDSKLKKLDYFQKLARSQIGLILDKDLEHIPFESMPTLRDSKQGMFRIPSLRIFHVIASRCHSVPVRVDQSQTAYILDPSSNLVKTRERFENSLKAHRPWIGVIGQPPKADLLEDWLRTKQVYLFIGHGAGTAYYNKLCKGRGLSAMPHIEAMPLVMGCSSGKVMAEGPQLESFGINWIFIFRGSPAYVGLLWDVTDTDIDRFFHSLLSNWMNIWNNDALRSGDTIDTNPTMMAITDVIAKSRGVCHNLLVGSTPVHYGLPACCGTSQELSIAK